MTLAQLPHNHMWHPDRWTPTGLRNDTGNRPKVGAIVGWRYAAWRVIDVAVRADADLTDDDRRTVASYKPAYQDGARPYTVVLRHERGPILVDHVQRFHDDSITVHLGCPAGRRHRWHIVDERYAVCACCNHPYPCQEYAQERIAEAEAERLGRLLDSHAPGVCMACREPVTTRQKVLVFPESSLLVPGAPGPTFHANRWGCWSSAREYETKERLPAYPDAARLASCPGLLFAHEAGGWEECTAGQLCTGFHGPKSNRGMACYTRTYMDGPHGGYPRPLSDCGYRKHGGCLGAEAGPREPLPQGITDLFGGAA